MTNNKVFVYSTAYNIVDSLSQIRTECELLFDFPLKYKIQSIIEIKSITDSTNQYVNTYVKQYMTQYGIENVRGGSYTNIVLSTSELNALNNELNNEYVLQNEIILRLFDELFEYDQNHNNNRDFKDSWSSYTALNEYCESLGKMFDYTTISSELEWMKTQLITKLYYTRIDSQMNIQRYSEIKQQIKRFSKIVDTIHMNYPDKERITSNGLREIFRPIIHQSTYPETRLSRFFKEDMEKDLEKDMEKDMEDVKEIDAFLIANGITQYDYDMENTTPEEFAIFMSNPEFIFDQYLLHNQKCISTKEIKYVLHAFAIIQYYFDYIKLHITEIELDLDLFPFMTDLKYQQFTPSTWRRIYNAFLERVIKYQNAGLSGNPNAGGTENCVNDDAA